MPVFRAVAASALIAFLFAILSVSSVSLLPPKLQSRDLQYSGATAHVMIDLPQSRIADRRATWTYFDALRTRADLLARLMASTPAREYIGRHAGVPPDEIGAVAAVTASVQSVLTEPGSEQRAHEIALAGRDYRLEIQPRPGRPILDIYSQAPTTAEAERLAGGAIDGLREYLQVLATQEGVDPAQQVRLVELGPARGGVLNPGVELKVAGLTFLVVFGLACSLLLALTRRRVGPAALQAVRRIAVESGDWPRTTRVLPWMLAAFMAVLWLVPFDSIQLRASLPVDLKFDRLVLPFVFVTWLLSLIAGGPGAPRLRWTWIHGAVGAFVALACLSVILDAGSLNRSLELDTSLKKLPLLLAYLSIFVMVASVIRRSEVRAFMTYTLLLALICALGMIWEYRFQHNFFFDWAEKLLPGPFEIASIDSGYDLLGRRVTHGPAAHGLVAVTMLAMAMPIAIVRLVHSERWRTRILYGLAAGVLMVAVFATQRKTAVVAPLSGVLTLAYFRRRELLRLAPVAVVALIVVVIASPGTVAPVIEQFQPDRLGADTVSDRASDYDAIRPDVWTHVAFGRGYGSYQPLGHRILDSEMLVRTVEMGVLGLVAYLLLGASVVATARRMIASRHPAWAPQALVGAGAAVVFLVVGALFDAMSFPQGPYIFLCLAALVAAVVKPPDEGADQPRPAPG